MTNFRMTLITTAVSLALPGAVHNASARDCSDPRVVICDLGDGAAKSDARVAAPGAVMQPRATKPNAIEPADRVDEEPLAEEDRLPSPARQQDADGHRARQKELQRQELERRRGIADGRASESAARRGSSRSESELGFSRSRSEMGFDRSDSEIGR